MKFLKLSESVLWNRYAKYLLLVPVLVVVAIGSYKTGRSSSTSAETHAADKLRRERRDVTNGSVRETYSAQGGAVYVRWGRTTCPSDSDEVYSGVVGGSHYDTHGGGSNHLCLPMDPIWDTFNEAVEKGSKIYGAEYESPQGFNFENNGGRTTHDHNVPCAVCRSQTKTSVVMIPARNICYNGWKAEYNGYLMSGHPGQKGRTEFVCIDKSPESDPAGYRDENGALFYSVEGVCGSLPCPPYVQRREITCVVCSK